MRILAVNWRDIRDPMAGGAEIHLHEILKRAVAAGHEVDLAACSYPGAEPREEIDGVRVHRRGHWLVANWVLPHLVRRLLRERRYDLIVDDINKIPFYTPLYRRGVPVLAVVPHLFGATVFRETNPLFGAFLKATQVAGYAPTDDVNGYRQEGFAKFDRNVHRGRRLSASKAYLKPARKRPNLTVKTRALVTRVQSDAGQRYQCRTHDQSPLLHRTSPLFPV